MHTMQLTGLAVLT